jgi:choline dehydrogenase-like flavoprotein
MSEAPEPGRLACGCQVQTARDFLGRVVGTILARAGACPRGDHQPGHVVLMPGRDNARPE